MRPSHPVLAEASQQLAHNLSTREKILFISNEFAFVLAETITNNNAEHYGLIKVLVSWALHLDGRFALQLVANGASSLRYLLIAEDRIGVEVVYNLLSSVICAIFAKPSFDAIIEDLDAQRPSTSRLRNAEYEISRIMNATITASGIILAAPR
jgi:hypothetical protein